MGFWLGGSVSASLVTGAIACVGFNTDGSDGFAFVALNHMDANSTIFFAVTSGRGRLSTPGRASSPGNLV